MVWRDAVILAAVQGVTEFLPVSSSGHLVAARFALGVSDAGGAAFDALLHLGTLLAVLVYFRRQWWALARSLVRAKIAVHGERALAGMLMMATLPAAAAGWFTQAAVISWRTPTAVAAGLLTTAVVLAAGELVRRRVGAVEKPRWHAALIVGFVQAAAVLPGVSRSGMTIAAGLASGMSRHAAVVFSFLLSVPVTAGAVAASLPALSAGGYSGRELWLGLLVSFLTGLLGIKWLLRMIERVGLWPFAVYLCFVAGWLLYAT